MKPLTICDERQLIHDCGHEACSAFNRSGVRGRLVVVHSFKYYFYLYMASI